MTARQRQQPAIDEKVFDIRTRIEQIAVRNHNISHLPRFDRTELIRNAKYLGGI
jgi:hypothetical protein